MQIAFPSEHGLKTFISAKHRVEIDLASLFTRQLTAQPHCDVETALYLVSPDAKQNDAFIYDVTEGNCSECFSMLNESDVFQFKSRFRLHQSSDRSRADGELLQGMSAESMHDIVYTYVTFECMEGANSEPLHDVLYSGEYKSLQALCQKKCRAIIILTESAKI